MGLSTLRCSRKAGLHHNYVGEIERGEKAAGIDTLVKIARTLGLPLHKLLLRL